MNDYLENIGFLGSTCVIVEILTTKEIYYAF